MKFNIPRIALASLVIAALAMGVRADDHDDDAVVVAAPVDVSNAQPVTGEVDHELVRVGIPEGTDDDDFDYVAVPKSSATVVDTATETVVGDITSTITASETRTVVNTVYIPQTTSITNTITASDTNTVYVAEVTPTVTETVTSTTPVVASTEVTMSQVVTETVSVSQPTETVVDEVDDVVVNSAGTLRGSMVALVGVAGGILALA